MRHALPIHFFDVLYLKNNKSDKLRVRVPNVVRYNAKWRSSPRLRHFFLRREGVGSYLFSFFSHLLVSAGNVQQRFHLEIEKSRTWFRKSAFFSQLSQQTRAKIWSKEFADVISVLYNFMDARWWQNKATEMHARRLWMGWRRLKC